MSNPYPPLINATTVHGLGELARRAMQTPVVINRRNVEYQGSTIVSDDLGDDEVSYDATTESTSTTVYGSLSTNFANNVQVEQDGALVTIDMYKLILPVGTDIRPGDSVLAGGDTYAVADVSLESTWQALLVVSMRKLE